MMALPFHYFIPFILHPRLTMSTEQDLHERSGSACELCNASDDLTVFEVAPAPDGTAATSVLLCPTCREQIENPEKIDVHHWRCLNESMWSEVPAVQVLAWRMLKQLSAGEAWAQDLLDTLFLEDDVQAWAEAGVAGDEPEVKHLDSNGTLLETGDTVTLIKDLDVKGGGFTAKRGTVVKGIALVEDNPEHIEGRVNGQRIVILTKFVKKSAK